jgi:hypothetical protein
MTLHPDGLPVSATPDANACRARACDYENDRRFVVDYDLHQSMEVRARTAEAKVEELERLVAWLRRAEFKNLYKPHPSSPVFIMAEEVEQHLASSPPPEWKTPSDNSEGAR